MIMSGIFIYVLIFCFVGNLDASKEKRLLINDPDVLANRITALENTINQMKLEIQKQDATIQQLTSDKQKQDATIHTMNNEYQRHTAEIQSLKSLLDSQRFIGGGHYGESGSSAEPVCLPPDPNFVKTSGTDQGRMYGAEFYGSFFHPSGDAEDLPCAVCRVKRASSVIMIPGKNTCYSGWTLQYHGYLASNNHDHAAAGSFVCIDIQPEFLTGGADQHYGKLFYSITAKCGSLQCPPYKNGYPLTCVVCSK